MSTRSPYDARSAREVTQLKIDVHAHAIEPSALAEMASSHPDWGPVLVADEDRKYLQYPGRARLGPLPDSIFDPELRLAAMSRQRVDRQIIAIPPPNFHYHIPGAAGNDFARIQNDHLVRLCESNPDRFHAFAALPLQDIEASLSEIDRIAGFPLVRGVQIGTNVNGMEMDDPALGPVWDALQANDLPVWFHPDQRSIAGSDRLSDYYLQNFIGLPLESTIAAARLIFGGVMVRFPALRFGFVHGGGFAPYQIGRLDHGWHVRPEPKQHLADPKPSELYRRFFIDSLTHDAASLELLGRRVGWDQVVLGSDFPFDMASTDPVGGVEAVDMTDAERQAVFSGNAERFLRPLAG